MENEQMQPNNTDPMAQQDQLGLSNDELAAAMGFMTTMGEQQMQAQMPQEEVAEETPEESVEEPKEEEDGVEEELQAVKDEIASLREEIEKALEDNEKEDEKE